VDDGTWIHGRDARLDAWGRAARFFTKAEVDDLIRETGLVIGGYRSTLFQPPGLETYRPEDAVDGCDERASFVAVAAERRGPPLRPAAEA
jgi:hypothetical protein